MNDSRLLLPERLRRYAGQGVPWTWLRAGAVKRLVAVFLALAVLPSAAVFALAAIFPGWHEAGVDRQLAEWVADRRTDRMLALGTLTAYLGKIWVVAPLVMVVGYLVWRRAGHWLAFWVPAFAGAGGFGLSVTIKYLMDRPRPPGELSAVEAFGPSYPSGHVIRTTAVYGALAWLYARSTAGVRRILGFVGAGVATVAVGVARVMEGAHWLSDVLASYAIGVGWLSVVLVVSGLTGRDAAPASTESTAEDEA